MLGKGWLHGDSWKQWENDFPVSTVQRGTVASGSSCHMEIITIGQYIDPTSIVFYKRGSVWSQWTLLRRKHRILLSYIQLTNIFPNSLVLNILKLFLYLILNILHEIFKVYLQHFTAFLSIPKLGALQNSSHNEIKAIKEN